MKQMFSQLFSDLKLLYKNFIHWNVSKLLISIMSFVLWIILALPFFLLAFLVAYFSPIDWKTIFSSLYLWNWFDFLLLSVLYNSIVYVVFIVIFLVLWLWFFFFWNSYKYVLISNLYLKYLDWEKFPFFKWNIYFSKKYILKYLGLLWITSLYLLAPFIWFLVLALITIFLFWWFESVWTMMWHSPINWFSILLLLLFIAAMALFFYISFRIQFAYFSFLDDTREFLEKSKIYIKESIKNTKWIKIFWKYLVLIISMWILLAPFFMIEANISWNLSEYKLLYSYKTDDTFVKNMDEDTKYEAALLEKKYNYLDNDDLKYELTKYNAYSNIWGIFFFLFLGNIENMFFVSFYRRVINNRKNENLEE